MKINTKYFGELSFPEEEALQFPEGLFGFEEHHNYIPIHFDDENDNLLCLQCVTEETLAFVIVNPFSICPTYQPNLSDEELAEIDATQDTPVAFFSICVVRDTLNDSTVNLRCPIVVNVEKRIAKQFILEDTSYPFKYPFNKAAQKEG